MASTRPLVCVVGASYGGLSAALGFARQGAKVLVAEAAPSLSRWEAMVPSNQHVGLWSPALRILDDIYGVSVCTLPKACVAKSSYRAHDSGARLAEPSFTLDAFCTPLQTSDANSLRAEPSPSLCFFRERDVRTALLAKCEQSPNINIVFGAALQRSPRGQGTVGAFEGERGDSVNERLQHASATVRLVVGADGKRSVLRRSFWEEPAEGWLQPRGYSVFRGFTPTTISTTHHQPTTTTTTTTTTGVGYPELLGGEGEAFQAWGPDTRFAAVPAPGGVAWFLAAGATSLEAVGRSSASETPPGVGFQDENLQTCRSIVASWHGDVQEILARAEPQVSCDVAEASPTDNSALLLAAPFCPLTGAERRRVPIIALVGDAANTVDPILAQGAGVAIEQGFVLAQCVAQRLVEGGGADDGEEEEEEENLVINGLSADVLTRYDSWQKQRCRRLRQISNVAQQFGQVRTPFICEGRNTMLAVMPSQLKSAVFDAMIRASLEPCARLD